MIELLINREPHRCAAPVSLSQLLTEKNLQHTRGIAVAVNDAVIPRAAWETTRLQSHDNVTIIQATQGG